MKKILGLLLLVTILSCNSNKNKFGYIVETGDVAPNFEIVLQDGTKLNLEDLKGKVVMIQFTASWCSVCRKEMPHIEKDIWQKYKENSDFYIIALARKDSLANMLKMVDFTGITYPITLDTGDKIFTKYALPEAGVTRNVIIDKNGKIRLLTRLFKMEEFNKMKKVIAKLLAE